MDRDFSAFNELLNQRHGRVCDYCSLFLLFRLCSETMSSPAKVWHQWCLVAGNDMALMWCGVEEQIVVKSVQCLKWTMAFEHTKLLSLLVKQTDKHKKRRPAPEVYRFVAMMAEAPTVN